MSKHEHRDGPHQNLPEFAGTSGPLIMPEDDDPPGRREKSWVVQFYSKGTRSDFFRFFTSVTGLMDSLGVDPRFQHPCWANPFEIYELDFRKCKLIKCTAEIMNMVASKLPLTQGEHEEENPTVLS